MSVVSRPCFSNSPASFMIHGTACEPAIALQPNTSLSAAREEPGIESMSNIPKTTDGKRHDVIRFGSNLLKPSIFIIVCSKGGTLVNRQNVVNQWFLESFTCPNVCRRRYKLSLRSRREFRVSQGF